MASPSEVHSSLESTRLHLGRVTSDGHKARLGQYMTPASIAEFMAGLFEERHGECRLLDPGAGIGSLSAAFLGRNSSCFSQIDVTACECDPAMHEHLALTLAPYRVRSRIVTGDFIGSAVMALKGYDFREYTHAILNPPYKKMNTDSSHRRILRKVGIETVNLYSAFTALALLMLESQGQLVAIIPRSFCNGPYYLPFREFLLANAAIRQIHLFASRTKAFKDDKVLQENVIVHLVKNGVQGRVVVSTSSDGTFEDIDSHSFEFAEIVRGKQKIIHLPTSADSPVRGHFSSSLHDIGVEVSTGPVVDFRLRDFISADPVDGSVPLLYATHFANQQIEWPKPGKKPNAILHTSATRKWLYPRGYYAVVRRFSSKEEKQRITASVCDPRAFDGAEWFGFENHLNVFHCGKQGLPEDLARGLSLYLNSTMIDREFRAFNGHTQVNASDLRLLRYPDREALVNLGLWAKDKGILMQKQIDNKLESLA